MTIHKTTTTARIGTISSMKSRPPGLYIVELPIFLVLHTPDHITHLKLVFSFPYSRFVHKLEPAAKHYDMQNSFETN